MCLTSGIIRVEDVPGAPLGFLSCWGLLPETVRRPAWVEPRHFHFTSGAALLQTGPDDNNTDNNSDTQSAWREKKITFVSKTLTSLIHIRRTSVAAVLNQSYEGKITCNLPGHFFFLSALGTRFLTACCLLLHITPNHCTIFWGGGSFLRNNWVVWGYGTMCHIMHRNPTFIFWECWTWDLMPKVT